jgi:hypothetical protein
MSVKVKKSTEPGSCMVDMDEAQKKAFAEKVAGRMGLIASIRRSKFVAFVNRPDRALLLAGGVAVSGMVCEKCWTGIAELGASAGTWLTSEELDADWLVKAVCKRCRRVWNKVKSRWQENEGVKALLLAAAQPDKLEARRAKK